MPELKKIPFLATLLLGSLMLCSVACGSKDDEADPGGNGGGTDTIVKVTVQDLSIDEGSTDKNIFVRIQLSTASQQLNTVYISSRDVSATDGEDFVGFSNIPIVFPPGDLIKDHQIKLKGDEKFENNEVFEVVIGNVEGGATIDKGVATITILNDEEGTSTTDIPSSGYSTPDNYPNMALIWQDEFSGTVVDESNWTFELGNGNSGWGNNELQFYKKENASIVDGHLVIEAKKNLSPPLYTSTRMITKGKFDFQFGRVDIRAALPRGQGIWPALWMLGSNIQQVSWPACGEIDIMEVVGHEPNTCHGTAHWRDGGGNHALYSGTKLSATSLHDEFHVYSIIWSDGQIRWLLDDVQYHVLNTSPADLSEFNSGNFFFIFNVAVGGNWPGPPNATTEFPQHMIVDYIRVFQ